jgi:hypothetical protein
MIPNPVEIAPFLFPRYNINTRKVGGRARFTPIFKENRETKVRILRHLIRSGQYRPDGYAIADAVLFGDLAGAVGNRAAFPGC